MRFQQSSSSAPGEHARLRGVAGPADDADENDAAEQRLGEPALTLPSLNRCCR